MAFIFLFPLAIDVSETIEWWAGKAINARI
jgi:hypothetical protein